MNEDELARLLRATPDEPEVPTDPVAAVNRRGRAIKRRRFAAGAAVVLVVAAGGGTAVGLAGSRSDGGPAVLQEATDPPTPTPTSAPVTTSSSAPPSTTAPATSSTAPARTSSSAPPVVAAPPPTTQAPTVAYQPIVEPFDPGHPAEAQPVSCSSGTTQQQDLCYRKAVENTDLKIDQLQSSRFEALADPARRAMNSDDQAWLANRGTACGALDVTGDSVAYGDVTGCLLAESRARYAGLTGQDPFVLTADPSFSNKDTISDCGGSDFAVGLGYATDGAIAGIRCITEDATGGTQVQWVAVGGYHGSSFGCATFPATVNSPTQTTCTATTTALADGQRTVVTTDYPQMTWSADGDPGGNVSITYDGEDLAGYIW